MRHLIIALGLALAAVPASAQSQLEQNVARDLPRLGFDVDTRTLTNGQLAAIYSILHSSSHTTSEKRRQIRSALGGQYSLRGLLSRS